MILSKVGAIWIIVNLLHRPELTELIHQRRSISWRIRRNNSTNHGHKLILRSLRQGPCHDHVKLYRNTHPQHSWTINHTPRKVAKVSEAAPAVTCCSYLAHPPQYQSIDRSLDRLIFRSGDSHDHHSSRIKSTFRLHSSSAIKSILSGLMFN